jgi:hypothetical protein
MTKISEVPTEPQEAGAFADAAKKATAALQDQYHGTHATQLAETKVGTSGSAQSSEKAELVPALAITRKLADNVATEQSHAHLADSAVTAKPHVHHKEVNHDYDYKYYTTHEWKPYTRLYGVNGHRMKDGKIDMTDPDNIRQLQQQQQWRGFGWGWGREGAGCC